MRNSIMTLVLAGALVLSVVAPVSGQAPPATMPADPISVLKSDAPFNEKAEACRLLSHQGTREAVPVLAAMLLDEKLSHMARYALEPMPFPEAGQALRDALGKTSGRLKVGIINSLAIRKDEQAVPDFIKLLSDGDAVVAQTAAESLGKIGTPEASKALLTAIGTGKVPPGNLAAFCNGLMVSAETLAASKDKQQVAQALALYKALLKTPNAPSQVRAAALRGKILTQGAVGTGQEAAPLLVEALGDKDDAMFDAALRTSRELGGGDGVTAALAVALPTLPAERKIRLMQALAERGGIAAGPAVLAEAKEGPADVRVAALNALTRMGYAPALDLMAKLAFAEDQDLALAARNSLSYFPGDARVAALQAMLGNEKAEARRVAVELIGQGGLDKPAGLLMKAAEGDADENVRVAALNALQDCAGIEEMPGLLDDLLKARSQPELQAASKALEALSERQKRTSPTGTGGIVIQKALYGNLPDGPSADVTGKVADLVKAGSISVEASNGNFGDTAPGMVKKLRVEYTQNGTPANKTVQEGETLTLTVVSAPPAVVDAFCSALDKAQGETKAAVLPLLRSTGSPKALETVRAVAAGEGTLKAAALRTLCDWPTPDALPTILELVKTSPDQTIKVLALRGSVRLLKEGEAGGAELLQHYAVLMDSAPTADEKKLVLSGLAQVHEAAALEMALGQFNDEAVKAEAIQAAIAIAKDLGKAAREDNSLCNGKDLAGWKGNAKYWRFEDGAVVGHSNEPIPANEFIWSGVEVRDFYLAVSVKLEPNSANGGIQFRSKKVDERGQALGYQADIGQDVWGRLYHEHGRGKLDWNDRAEKAVKPGEWNRYEILAVGPAIWTAVNGTLGVAYLETAVGPSAEAERSGLMAFQIHAGPPMTARYRIEKLVHDPTIELAGLTAENLIAALGVPEKK